jgi:RNA polymerase sigma factor (sigma-70 family)
MISISDEDIVAHLRAGEEHYLNKVYDKCKNNAIGFLRQNGADIDTAEDIFQDAVIVFYENIRNNSFEQKSAIQTYLNSVCRFRWLNTIRDKKEFIANTDFNFDENIRDSFEEYEPAKEERISKIEIELINLKAKGGKCYDILYAYFYENKSMKNIAEQFEYTNDDNAKSQKAKCQKQLKEMVHG